MVGNDIVDLGAPESDSATLHPRFDLRVFRAHERESVAADPTPSRQRWRLWAAKEAAFKLARQCDPRAVFSPIRFEVSLDPACEGTRKGEVRHGATRYRVQVQEGPGFIHALAIGAGKRFGDIATSVRRCDEVGSAWQADCHDERSAVRRLVCSEMSSRLGVPGDELEVRKEGRIPFLWRGSRRLPLGLSLSHHGAFIAYACVDPGAQP